MKQLILIIIFLYYFSSEIYSQETFHFNKQAIPSGTKSHFKIPITDHNTKTFIPVTVFHGVKKGPVLGITAGVHGYEYPPIMAGQQLIQKIDPKQLNGTIILVQIANIGSFLGRSPYLNPLDGKNLNRSFPGNSSGTITERIAYYISEEIIKKCDFFLDIHGGDAPEDLMPYVAYYEHDQFPKISEKGRLMASHLGFDHVVVFKTTQKGYMKKTHPSTYCSAQAFKMGIPSIDIECGRLGQSESDLVLKIVNGVYSLLQHLQIIEGQAIKPSGIITIEQRSYINSLHDGFFYPLKKSGDYVVKGLKLGYVTDFFNKTVQEVFADQDGVLLLILGTPPVNVSETVAVIGVMR